MQNNNKLADNFIDLAKHGGCSKKAPALQLKNMLHLLSTDSCGTPSIKIDSSFSDSGIFSFSGKQLVSSVDVVLPLTHEPDDFGEITVSHVLSDLYAAGAYPLFALCILGLPTGLSVDDHRVIKMMAGANAKLQSEGAILLGGHTLADQDDLSLGFAAVGTPWLDKAFPHAKAKVGDIIILTKPLGTSLASLRWKLRKAKKEDHFDVLEGMKTSNKKASKVLSNFPITACTDITGYGLLGHLHEILLGSKKSAIVDQSNLKVYESVNKPQCLYETMQFRHNKSYVDKILSGITFDEEKPPKNINECLLFDAQVSGGLLFCLPKSDVKKVTKELKNAGCQPWIVGEIVEGKAGTIKLTGAN